VIQEDQNEMEGIIKGVAMKKCIAEKNKARERMIQREPAINYVNYQGKRRQHTGFVGGRRRK
jgi:hypothetical protein